MSHNARSEYASLVVASCGLWSDEHFELRVQRSDVSSYNLDPFSWPSPVAAFLEYEQWMPMGTPQARAQTTLVHLRDAWHFSDRSAGSEDYAHPDYAPLIPLKLRRQLDAQPASLTRLREHGLNVWNDPADSARLVQHLGQLVYADETADQYAANIRRAYEQAWEHALDSGAGEEAAASHYLVVTCSGQLATFDTTSPDQALYVHDGGSRLADSLLQLSSRPLVDVDARTGIRVAEHLEDRLGDRVLRLRRGAFRRLTAQVRERILKTLHSVKLRFASEILLQIGSDVLPPPQAMREAVPIPDEHNPAIIVRGTGPDLSWAQLESLLPALADLIGYGELTPALQLASTRLAPTDKELRVTEPSLQEIAEALDEPEQRVREVIRNLRGSAAAVLDLLDPVLLVLAGPDAYERFAAETRELEDEEDVFAVISALELDVSTDELQSLARGSGSIDDLRRSLNIPLGEFNRALRALGRPPIQYTAEHAQVFATFVADHRDEALTELRRAYLPLFRTRASLTNYVEARDGLQSLGPDRAWLDEHEVPPDALR